MAWENNILSSWEENKTTGYVFDGIVVTMHFIDVFIFASGNRSFT